MTTPPLTDAAPPAVLPDPVRAALLHALRPYRERHPLAEVEVSRHDDDAVALRIVDPDFADTPLTARNGPVRDLLADAPPDARRALTYLLLLTPEEVAELAFSGPEFPPGETGPVPFRRNEVVYRRESGGRSVYATVGQPWVSVGGDLWPSRGFTASIKFDVPPGIVDPHLADPDHPAAVDTGETLRDDHAVTRFFTTREQARDAAFAEAGRRIARYAALHPAAGPVSEPVSDAA